MTYERQLQKEIDQLKSFISNRAKFTKQSKLVMILKNKVEQMSVEGVNTDRELRLSLNKNLRGLRMLAYRYCD